MIDPQRCGDRDRGRAGPSPFLSFLLFAMFGWFSNIIELNMIALNCIETDMFVNFRILKLCIGERVIYNLANFGK